MAGAIFSTDETEPWWTSAQHGRPGMPAALSWRQQWRRLTSRIMPFSPRERAISPSQFRARLLLLGSLLALVVLTALGSVAAFGLAARIADGANQLTLGVTQATPPGGVVIQPLVGGAAPTPTVPAYLIGAWVSDSAPASGSVQVFVRVSSNTGSPVAGVPVHLSVGGAGYGPATTDSYGLATFNVGYGGGYNGYTPVFVTATAVVNGQTLTAQTSFSPR